MNKADQRDFDSHYEYWDRLGIIDTVIVSPTECREGGEMKKKAKKSLSTFWVRLWNEHCAWVKTEVTDRTYAITGRLFLNTLRKELEDLGLFDFELADFKVDKSEEE